MAGKKRDVKNKSGESRKEALSLLMLLAGGSIYKLGAVLAAMVLAETVLLTVASQNGTGMESNLYNHSVFFIFMMALGLVFFVLAHMEGTMGTKGRHTLRRLKLSGTAVFLIEAGYNLLCLTIIFIIQVWIAILAVKVWGGAAGRSVQGLFLAFYRIEFLHCLVPMEEAGKWLRNLLMLFALALGAARSDWEREYVLPALVLLITAIWFVGGIGSSFEDYACIVLYLLGIAEAIWLIWKRRETED